MLEKIARLWNGPLGTAILVAAIVGILALNPARAQTLNQPGQNGNTNTVGCLTFSTLNKDPNGNAIPPGASCKQITDTDESTMIQYALANCPPVQGTDSNGNPTSTPCTVPQAIGWYGQKLFDYGTQLLAIYSRQQAAAAVVPPNPTPAN